jgi:hypothetical protein
LPEIQEFIYIIKSKHNFYENNAWQIYRYLILFVRGD